MQINKQDVVAVVLGGPSSEAEISRVTGGAITIYCPARLESKLRGQKSCNLRYWEEYFPGLALQIIQDKADEIRVCPHVNPSHR